MASLISIERRTQEPFKNFCDNVDVINSSPETHEIDGKYPIIAKGNIIEGIEAKE